MAAIYPADTFQEGVDLTIEASNQLAQVVRGDASTEVMVADGSTIPSIRKAQADSMYFKEPEAWTTGQTETDYLQLKKYTDPTTNKESWWFAKGALVSNPIAMGTSPFGDDNWTLYTPEDLFISGKAEYESIYQALKGKAAEAGYNLVRGSFEEGGTLTGTSDVLWYQANGKYYNWFNGSAKTVVAGSTPATTGGVGAGAWLDRTDDSLRDEIRETVFQTTKRSYAEAGFNLVDGSFEAGGTLVNANDVLLQERTGKAFSGPAGTVDAGTNPTGGGFVDKSGGLLRHEGSDLTVIADGSTTPRRLGERFADVVNVKDFGAVGDGVTDDTAAIQDAIDYAFSFASIPGSPEVITTITPSKTVFIPYGDYRISETIIIKPYVNFIGAGRHNTVFRSDITDGTPVLKATPAGTVSPTYHSFYNAFRDFSIDGENKNCIGIMLDRCHRWTMNDVFIGETFREGLYIEESYIGEVYSILVRECGSESHAAVRLDGPNPNNGTHAVTFFGGEIINTFGNGVLFANALSSGLFGTTVEGCKGGTGVIFQSTCCFATGCYFELNKHHVSISATSNNITNNFFSHLVKQDIAAVTATTTTGSTVITLDTSGLEVGDNLSIEGETYTLVITAVRSSDITVHRPAEQTGTNSVSIENMPVIINRVASGRIVGNYFPPCKTDIGIQLLTASSDRTIIEGNKAFGIKNDIVIDPSLITISNAISLWDGFNYKRSEAIRYSGNIKFENEIYAKSGIEFSGGGIEIAYNSGNGELQHRRAGITSFATSGVGNRSYATLRAEKPDANTAMFMNLPVYSNNAAALAGGMTTGFVYRTATGEVRIVL